MSFELALIETIAHLGVDHILDGMRVIRAGLVVGITEEERLIRIAAVELLEPALQRFGIPAPAGLGN